MQTVWADNISGNTASVDAPKRRLYRYVKPEPEWRSDLAKLCCSLVALVMWPLFCAGRLSVSLQWRLLERPRSWPLDQVVELAAVELAVDELMPGQGLQSARM